MANTFSKEERVAFEDMVAGFDDALVLSRNVSKYNTDPQTMERTSNTIWRPVPYIAQSVNGPAGTDITASFTDIGQMSVPSSFGYSKTVPWIMNAAELRDALQTQRYGIAAAQKLASDINISIMDTVAAQATLCVVKATAAAGFADIANIEKLFNESGIPMSERYLALSTGDYNLLAADLAGRQNIGDPMAKEAYKQAFVGRVAGFETYKLDYANVQAARSNASVAGHVEGANQRHVPISTTSGSNIDNRTQTLAIHMTANTIQAGDFFTIAGIYNVHPITKVSTGVLKTFRCRAILSGAGGTGNITISPPIISADSTPTDIEQQYQNVSACPGDGTAITILNTTAAKFNPFWYKDCIELMPGKEAIEGPGVEVIQSTSPQGLILQLSKQWSLVSNKMFYRLDCRWGVTVTNPEMCGAALFGQA